MNKVLLDTDTVSEIFRQKNQTLIAKATADRAIIGIIYADLERAGQRIGYPDCMIASIAISHQLPLVTGNFSHYQIIINLGYSLVLKNWKI